VNRICLLAASLAMSAAAHSADWNATQKPFRIYGNTYYVGVHGLSAILITSEQGHILIDGDLQESVPKIAASIRQLGFRIEDVKLILNSHVHSDHAGGIAGLQRLSGADVAASALSAEVLRDGQSGPDDPQYGSLRPIQRLPSVKIVSDGEHVRVGPIDLTAHLTPGHTPGGTTWTWKSCENERCLNMVYADSLRPVSAKNYRFTQHPDVLKSFEKSFGTLATLPCDILVTPHPEESDLWTRRKNAAFLDPTACRRLADASRGHLAARVASEEK
jgi:metallo-beta-lactamase class B